MKLTIKALAYCLILFVVIAINVIGGKHQTAKAVAYEVGTASDPAFQQTLDPTTSSMCSIAHVAYSDRDGKRIAFMQDTATGKYICLHANKRPVATALVSLVPESFVGPLNVTYSYKLPDDTQWEQGWLSNPKHPNLWVLGLVEK